MKKILLNFTPFLLVALYLIFIGIYTLITDGRDWGGVAAIAMLVFGVILIIVDFGLKKFIKKYLRILIIELIIGLIIISWYYIKFG